MWRLEVMENTVALSQEQAEQLVDRLEKTWDDYANYLSAHEDKEALVAFFGGDVIEFDSDCMEHMDYLHDPNMQAALVAVGARGFVTIGDFQGDNAGWVWTHEFTEAGYVYTVGKVRELVNGKIPVTA